MKKKFIRILNLLLAVAIVFSTMCALPLSASAAESGTCGDNLTWTLDDNGTLTISGTGLMWNVDSFSDIPWYNYRKKITAVKIDYGVESIVGGAFEYCTSLTSVSIPNSVKYIGGYAFSWCTALKSITIPESVTSISGYMFNECQSLTDISIPDSVTNIGYCAFLGCAYKKNTDNWEDGALYIGNHLIAVKSTLDGTYSVRPGTKTIAEYAFDSCDLLTGIIIPDGVTGIGSCAFFCCKSLTSINIPDSVTSIGEHAFQGCTSLTSVTIPDGVTRIGSNAFGGCKSLTSVNIPDSVTSVGSNVFNDTAYYNDTAHWTGNVLYIGKHFVAAKESLGGTYSVRPGTKTIASGAFGGCSSLTGITVPDSVVYIGGGAFSGCRSLSSITIPDSVTGIGSYLVDYTAYYNDPANWTGDVLYIGKHLISSKKTLGGTYSVRPGTKTIADYAFKGCSSLTGITIPDSVTGIERLAFYESGLSKIYGSDGSYAQTYANENSIPFAIIYSVNNVFSDVVPGEWYVSAVQYAVDNGLFFGVSDTEFAPDEAMNRAMLVTVLWRLEGKPAVSAENKFTDVPADEWYTQAVIWASENGVVYGTGDGEFSPEDNITREQMAAILYRYAQKKGYDITASTDLNTFPDGGNASSYARGALSWACGSGLIFGSDGKLLPKDGASRAQVAAILMRYTEKVVQE